MRPAVITFTLSALFVVMWSSGFVGAEFGLGHAGTFTLLFWRYLLLAAILIGLTLAFRQWQRLPARAWVYHGTVGILAHAVWLIAVLLSLDLGVSPGVAAFVTGLQPMVTAVIASPFVGETTRPQQWLGVVLGLGSVALVVGDKVAMGGSLPAHLLPFVAVLAISVASVLDRRTRRQRTEPATEPPVLMTTTIHALASLAFITPFAGAVEGFEASFGWELAFAVVWLAVVVSLAAYGLMFVLLRRMEATKVSSLMYLSPPVTMVFAYLLFGDRLAAMDLAGLALAAVAVTLVAWVPKDRRTQAAVAA